MQNFFVCGSKKGCVTKTIASYAPLSSVHLPTWLRFSNANGKERAGQTYLLVGEGPMAYDDTLFQLGMDLTRSSTAQTEDHSCSEFYSDCTDHEERLSDVRKDKKPVRSAFIDLYGSKAVSDEETARVATESALAACGGKLKSFHVRNDGSAGLTGYAELERGRVSFRLCPKSGITAVDAREIEGLKPANALIAFAQAFGAREAVLRKTCRQSLVALDVQARATTAAPVGTVELARARAA